MFFPENIFTREKKRGIIKQRAFIIDYLHIAYLFCTN